MSSSTTSMHNTLRDALVVKAMKFLTADLILEQHWTVIFTARANHPKPSKYPSQLTRGNRHMLHTSYLYQKL